METNYSKNVNITEQAGGCELAGDQIQGTGYEHMPPMHCFLYDLWQQRLSIQRYGIEHTEVGHKTTSPFT